MLHQKINSIIIVFLIAVAIITTLFSIGSYWSQPGNIGMFFNGDLVTLTNFAHSLIHHQDQFHNWRLSYASSLFPDFAIIYFLSLLINNAYVVLLFFSLIQISFFILIVTLLFHSIFPKSSGWRVGIILSFLFLVLLARLHPFILYSNYDYLITILTPSFHFGPYLFTLLALLFLIKILFHHHKNKILFFVLSILLLSINISDPLTHYYFTFPALATISIYYFLNYLDRKVYLQILFLLLLSFIFSTLIYYYAPLSFTPKILSIHFSWNDANLMLNILAKHFIENNLFMGIPWLLYLFFTPISLIVDFSKKINKKIFQ